MTFSSAFSIAMGGGGISTQNFLQNTECVMSFVRDCRSFPGFLPLFCYIVRIVITYFAVIVKQSVLKELSLMRSPEDAKEDLTTNSK